MKLRPALMLSALLFPLALRPCHAADQAQASPGLWDLVTTDDPNSVVTNVLKGVRFPDSDADKSALDAATKKDGLTGCQKWLYPKRSEFWTYPPDTLENDISPKIMCDTLVNKLNEFRVMASLHH